MRQWVLIAEKVRQVDADSAMLLAQQVVDLAKGVSSPQARTHRMDAHKVLADIHSDRSDYTDAAGQLVQCIALAEETGDRRREAGFLADLGDLYRLQLDRKSALDFYYRSYRIRLALPDNAGLARVYNSIGGVYSDMGSHDSAFYYLKLSLRMKTEFGDTNGMARSCNNIGYTYSQLGQIDSALLFFHRALELMRTVGDQYALAMIYNGTGSEYIVKRDFKRALSYLDSSLVLSSAIGSDFITQINFHSLSQLHAAKGEHKKALEFHKRYATLRDSILNKSNQKKISDLTSRYERTRRDKRIAQLQAEAVQKDLRLKSKNLALYSLLGGMAVLGVFIVLLYQWLRVRRRLENQEALLKERRRISADMHDDIGSEFTRIAWMSEMLKRDEASGSDKETLKKISESASGALQRMGELVWSLNPVNDNLENLAAYLRRFAVTYFENSDIACLVRNDAFPKRTVSGDFRRSILLAFKEALHNITRHAQASRVDISIGWSEDALVIHIQDNGKGFDPDRVRPSGIGLGNMQSRMQGIGGKFVLENHRGTKITFALPL